MQVNSILQAVLFFSLLGIAAYTDIKKREIPGILCVAMVLISLLDFKAVSVFGILAALPFFIAAMISPSGIGGGDIKLMAAVGLVLGFWETMFGMTIGLAAVVVIHGIRILLFKKKDIGAEPKAYPLAPFLMFGFVCAYFL
ncbi:A24 family peptidase [Lacrimispora saccharolytica]|jgi:leader peptidase (prepilin peptidase)/N-methyltransferase|uniref:Peptidase A24A prepilin type IV n=1 Tax=Lacrimispora saccharolytica (strain ATCC 35040 / DSM 2544 / NRCC 2533 / WM1) TaxID=610130 RepID=D9R6H4_LACSW|nr:A24 family peptidase [Lacrimispora saccharolytica]ADL05384.1 peptidase A24A prepilin type IV [[Clostridium] saccharolyticum WM1]QRV20451.1 prepilin peptidase [Lacrimispora saccharolytica]